MLVDISWATQNLARIWLVARCKKGRDGFREPRGVLFLRYTVFDRLVVRVLISHIVGYSIYLRAGMAS